MTATIYSALDPAANGAMPDSSPAVLKRAEFLSVLSTAKVETFAFTIPGSRPSSSFHLQLFGSTAELTQPNETDGNIQAAKTINGNEFPGRFNTTKDHNGILVDGHWWQTKGDFVIKFIQHTKAFGFYGTDFGQFGAAGGTVKLGFYSNGFLVEDEVEVGPDTGDLNASLLFFGYTNDVHPFNEVRFTITQGPGVGIGDEHVIGFDDLVIGTLASLKRPYNGTGGFVNAPTECITACPPDDVNTAYINVPAGFTDRWSVWSCLAVGYSASIVATLYAGLNGTGAVIAGPFGLWCGSANVFYNSGIQFPGVARSVKITTSNGNFDNRVFFDHMEFGTPPPLPDAPVLDFSWEPFNSTIRTSRDYDGVKFGLDFEDLLPGADAVAGTYQPANVGSAYNTLYPGTVFTNAQVVRSKATGGTGLFNVRTLDTPTGAVLNLGRNAIKVATGQSSMLINLGESHGGFSLYYASASPVIITYYSMPNGEDIFGGTSGAEQTLPATGTCSLPDVDNVYCQWKLASCELSGGGGRSIRIQSADPNALFDWVTVGYTIPSVGTVASVDNLVAEYYNGGTDTLGTQGPVVPAGPPYPHTYGVQTPGSWYRSYYEFGPNLAPDYYSVPGDGLYPGIYGWANLANYSAAPKYINVVDGFIGRVSFFKFHGDFIGVYSGLNGTGTLLTSTPEVERPGGYTEYHFAGWARSIAFSGNDIAVIDGLRFGPISTNPILPYIPGPVHVESDTTGLSDGTNSLLNDFRFVIGYMPDGTISRWEDPANSEYSPDHWMREPDTWSVNGTSVQITFDGLTTGATAFPNTGTLGGVWDSNSSSVAISEGVSKWGTSSLHVIADNEKPSFELYWPAALECGSGSTLECWVRPEYGTALPFGYATVLTWITGYYTNVFVRARPTSTAGQVAFDAYFGNRLVGSTTVAAGAFHHVAVTAAISGGFGMSFFVNGALIGSGTASAIGGAEASIRVGEPSQTGTFNYYVSDLRFTRNTVRYTGAYTMPGNLALTPQTPVTFAGANKWIRADLSVTGAGEWNEPDVTPYNYSGMEFGVWHKMDVPRCLAMSSHSEAKQQWRLRIATDAAGTNVIAETHGLGANVPNDDSTREFVGGPNMHYLQTQLVSSGFFEPFVGTENSGQSSGLDNELTNRLRKWNFESFEGHTVGAVSPHVAYYSRADGSRLTCTITSTDAVIVNTSATGQSNRTAGGAKWLSLGADTLFTFSEPICSFGFATTDVADNPGFVKMVLTDVTGTVKELVFPKNELTGFSFNHPGNEYVSVLLTTTTGVFGDMGIDNLVVATRDNLRQAIISQTDSFGGSGTLADSWSRDTGKWVDFGGNSALTKLVLTGSGDLQVGASHVGSTSYGAVLDRNTQSPDVTLSMGTYIPPMSLQGGQEFGFIARKNGNDYYHLRYTYYAEGTRQRPRTVDNGSDVVVMTLTHYPSGHVLVGPTEGSAFTTGTLTWVLQGNMHCIYSPFTQMITVYDDRNLTGTQHGFTIIQPSA